jgi:hypothetical protein
VTQTAKSRSCSSNGVPYINFIETAGGSARRIFENRRRTRFGLVIRGPGGKRAPSSGQRYPLYLSLNWPCPLDGELARIAVRYG